MNVLNFRTFITVFINRFWNLIYGFQLLKLYHSSIFLHAQNAQNLQNYDRNDRASKSECHKWNYRNDIIIKALMKIQNFRRVIYSKFSCFARIIELFSHLKKLKDFNLWEQFNYSKCRKLKELDVTLIYLFCRWINWCSEFQDFHHCFLYRFWNFIHGFRILKLYHSSIFWDAENAWNQQN